MYDYTTPPDPDEITARDMHPNMAFIAGHVSLIAYREANFIPELTPDGVCSFSQLDAPHSCIIVTECAAGFFIEVYPTEDQRIKWATILGNVEEVCDLITNSTTCK